MILSSPSSVKSLVLLSHGGAAALCTHLAGLKISLTAPDTFGSLLAAGITAMLALQVLINIGMVTGSLPVTGINLPLISAGGSSVFFNLFGLGILLNISRHCRQ